MLWNAKAHSTIMMPFCVQERGLLEARLKEVEEDARSARFSHLPASLASVYKVSVFPAFQALVFE